METNNNNQAKQNLMQRAIAAKERVEKEKRERKLKQVQETLKFFRSIGIEELTFEDEWIDFGSPSYRLCGHKVFICEYSYDSQSF